MSGRYLRAPLSYVVARLSTSTLAELKSEQSIELQQSFSLLNYIHKESASINQLDFDSLSTSLNKDDFLTQVKRTCFLDTHRRKAVVYDANSIELRTTSYTKYDDFMRDFEEVRKAFLNAVPAYAKALINEVTLTYIDVIVPAKDYNLRDFFAKGESALPLNAFGETNGALIFAKNEINEIVDATHRVFLSIEQLPQKLRRFVPEFIVEPEKKFLMPIQLEYEPQQDSDAPYAVVSTQAAQLFDERFFGDVMCSDLFNDSHSSCREKFKKLINKKTCDVVWEYIEN
ncbi:TIGR04255 family protein [Pantoea agglomerans]